MPVEWWIAAAPEQPSAAKHLTAALALVRAQVPPYLPAQAVIGQPAGLSIEYAAPSPLGLLTAVLDADRSVKR